MSSYESKKNMTVNAVEISAGDYYKSWVAYDALVQASSQSSFRSVWKVLACTCCPEPTCWESQVTEILPANLLSRIRWYDHALGGENACSSANASTSSLSSADLHQLREHFVSHHQRIELILVALQPSLARICSLMRYQIEQHDQLQKLNLVDARFIVQECKYACNGWVAVTHLMRGVAKLDRMKYLKYVTSLAGVSGGNSPNMMALTHKTGSLESFFDRLSDETLSQHMNNQTPVGLVAQAFMDCLDALSRCWLDHVVTATTAIGITHGTKGTPNTILVERVLRRLHGSRLLKALGSLRTPMTGTGIEMRQLRDYETYPLADHYVALFDDVGPEFGTHSIGFPPRIFDEAKREFAEIRRSQRTKLWEYFYKTIRPAYCLELKRLLVGVDGEDFVFGIGLGSSVTEVLARLVASIQLLVKASDLTVWMADDEFVTFQRVAALLGQSGATVRRTSIYDVVEQSTVNLLSPSDAMGEEKEEQEQIERLVFVSLVNSCTQKVVSVDWIEHVPLSTIVVLDVTQAVANLPLTLGPVVVRPNVFLVGSLIKVSEMKARMLQICVHSQKNCYCPARPLWRRTWISHVSGGRNWRYC
ncbi:hypothetical protein MPSEU_000524600 [Mayamaea pseudoterrestris]|nr:hypothetical protein MPSEU_000524600 [Mayamaea pseudoterrestris]